jgi:hypothetical protein
MIVGVSPTMEFLVVAGTNGSGATFVAESLTSLPFRRSRELAVARHAASTPRVGVTLASAA